MSYNYNNYFPFNDLLKIYHSHCQNLHYMVQDIIIQINMLTESVNESHNNSGTMYCIKDVESVIDY